MIFKSPEKTIHIKLEGETTFQTYEGDFTFKILLSLEEMHSLELMHSRLLGDLENPSQTLLLIARIRSNLKYHIVHSPLWWQESDEGAKLFDFNVLLELQAELNKAISEYKEEQREKAKQKN